MKTITEKKLFEAITAMLIVTEANPEFAAQREALNEAVGTWHSEKHEEEALWQDMIAHYGGENQLDAFVEELGEAIQARNKVRRKNNAKTVNHLAEELVDVELLLKQVKLLVPEEDLAAWKTEKMIRIKTRLAESKMKRASNYRKALSQASGFTNLFNVLHEKGVVLLRSELEDVASALKKDVLTAEHPEEDMQEVKDMVLAHNGENFYPAENDVVVNEAKDGRGHGI